MEIKVFGVKWDIEDGFNEKIILYKDIVITVDETKMKDQSDKDELEELISDCLSDTTGFCHNGLESCEILEYETKTKE